MAFRERNLQSGTCRAFCVVEHVTVEGRHCQGCLLLLLELNEAELRRLEQRTRNAAQRI
jgi:hypothetical protein